MFKKNAKENQADQLGKTNRVVEQTVINGDLTATADLRFDGVLHGNLKVDGRVVVGLNAKIFGNIECENADIEGRVEGILKVRELLFIKSTANVIGELKIGKLSVEPGGNLEVSCQMMGDVDPGKADVASTIEKTNGKDLKSSSVQKK